MIEKVLYVYIIITYLLIMPPRGQHSLPGVFQARFSIRRVVPRPKPLPENPMRTALRLKVRELRLQGVSYPEIAIQMDISVGTVWNLVNKE